MSDAAPIGSRLLALRDPVRDAPFRAWLVYPTHAPAAPITLGPFSFEASVDAPLAAAEAPLPLVLVSHGTGSSPFLFCGLAAHLARAGYVVALVEHPGDCRGDTSLAGSDENLVGRPRHVRIALDAVLAMLGERVASAPVGVVGHSIGAATALTLAGATPWSRSGSPLNALRDERVGALVLLAPATFWFVPDGALADVRVPILVAVGEEDRTCPPWHGHLVHGSVPDRRRVTLQTLPDAGHLSFLDPLPPTAPWRDPPGFARDAFHAALREDVTSFLDRVLRGDALATGSTPRT